MIVLPGWTTMAVDAESAAFAGIELGHWLAGSEIKLDDPRYLTYLAMDVAEHFCRVNYSSEQNYWEERNYTGDMLALTNRVTAFLSKHPNWLNNDYRMAQGTETLADILAAE